jgi:hypothetical protein
VTEVPGYFSQGCGKHTALNQDDWFFKATIDDDVGDAHSLHDAIEAWLAGEGTSLVDTVPPTSSVCPP